MTAPTSAQKRERAAALAHSSAPAATTGTLAVAWDRPFDQLCYHVTTSGMARKDPARYGELLGELMTGTGCTEAEVLEHGLKVRSMLFFAEDRLARRGALASLVGVQQYPYRLPPVTLSF
jgi:hypothetical protein